MKDENPGSVWKSSEKSDQDLYRYSVFTTSTCLESSEFSPLFKYVCYSDLPTDVKKILPPVSLSDELSPEGSAWLCRLVLTSCLCLLIFFLPIQPCHTKSVGKPHNGKHVKLVFSRI